MSNSPKKRVSLPVAAAAVLAVVLLAAIAIPNFVPARFTSSGEPLSVRVRVADQDGVPIQGATVRIASGRETALTGLEGECEVIGHFPADGVVGRSGTMHLDGVLQVTAPGYQSWERSLDSLFGEEYDYFRQGSSLTQKVIMTK